MSDSGDKPGGFTVTDRRSFDASGERKEAVAPAAPATPASPDPATAASPEPATGRTAEPPRSLPPADFATLVLSLGSSALMHLGEAGEGGKAERNLPMAKHAIDLLTLLEEKTKGNLNAEEEHLIGGLLFDLRLRYVEALKTSPASA
jgi:hypothetical protein